MKILNSLEDLKAWRREHKGDLGFVPTMGALHEGHASLCRRAVTENPSTLVSVFINPTQFNDQQDFETYPQDLNADIHLLQKCGVDAVFVPSPKAMYPDQFVYEVREKKLSENLCGAHRPGHFAGMLTVVLKLLNLVRPDRAYFGEKDFQQLKLVQGLVEAFFLDVTIVPVSTVREQDGLAMSSRNRRLTTDQRQQASILPQILTVASSAQDAARSLAQKGFQVEYVEDWQGRRLAAVRLGDVRLIDNVPL